ncbi:MAG: helix-turn-helix transcriptional regulator [Candidatus Acidiferrales bacterium]
MIPKHSSTRSEADLGGNASSSSGELRTSSGNSRQLTGLRPSERGRTYMYPNLKLEIFKRGIHQNQLSRAVGINEAVLSKIIRGYREPSADERSLLSSYLQSEESWLFEKFDVVAETPVGNGGHGLQDAKDGES